MSIRNSPKNSPKKNHRHLANPEIPSDSTELLSKSSPIEVPTEHLIERKSSSLLSPPEQLVREKLSPTRKAFTLPISREKAELTENSLPEPLLAPLFNLNHSPEKSIPHLPTLLSDDVSLESSENNFSATTHSSARDKKLQARRLDNTIKLCQQFICGKRYKPLNLEQLSIRFNLPPSQYPLLETAIETLIKQGAVLQLPNGCYSSTNSNSFTNQEIAPTANLDAPSKDLPSPQLVQQKNKVLSHSFSRQTKILRGIFSLNHKGFGFVAPSAETPFPVEIFIPRFATGNAVSGDLVEVEITKERHFPQHIADGAVLSVITRSKTHVVGTIVESTPQQNEEKKKPSHWIIYAPTLSGNKQIIAPATKPHNKLDIGTRVVIEVSDWGSQNTDPTGIIAHVIGHVNDPKTDIQLSIEEFQLPEGFSPEVIEEAQNLSGTIKKAQLKERIDWRKEETFTIDPETAKDFDDALSLKLDDAGNYHLAVHIADVSHYVQPESHLDQEAFNRGNSTYLPGTCLPMLPERLANDLCSLKPNVDRLAVTAFITLDCDGNVLDYSFARTVIHSQTRFTYEQAKEVLDGTLASPHKNTLIQMTHLCHKLKSLRSERGSIEFATSELSIRLDQNGNPTHTQLIPYDITHQLVEEFMIKTNELVAYELAQKNVPIPYRIHPLPDPNTLKEFSSLVKLFGYSLSPQPSDEELQSLFFQIEEDAQNGSPDRQILGRYLTGSFIRSMKIAAYSSDNVGHFGLKLEYYSHFTSPIRRYADLITHRSLFGQTYTVDDINSVCQHVSTKERISQKAEMSTLQLKKYRLLQQSHQTNQPLDAVITKVRSHGIYFDLANFGIEGFIHVSELGDDYFAWEDRLSRLVGRKTQAIFSLGKVIQVSPKAIDLIRCEASWTLLKSVQQQSITYTNPQPSLFLPPENQRQRKPWVQEDFKPLIPTPSMETLKSSESSAPAPKKRGRPRKEVNLLPELSAEYPSALSQTVNSQEESTSTDSSTTKFSDSLTNVMSHSDLTIANAPSPRGRGRPRKTNPLENTLSMSTQQTNHPVARGRGRPPKSAKPQSLLAHPSEGKAALTQPSTKSLPANTPVKRGPGRPKKNTSVSQTSKVTQVPTWSIAKAATIAKGLLSKKAPSKRTLSSFARVIQLNDSKPTATTPIATKPTRGRPRKNTTASAVTPIATAPIEKRGRGRPRKEATALSPKELSKIAPPSEKRGRGRPRKNTSPQAVVMPVKAIKAEQPIPRGRGRPPKIIEIQVLPTAANTSPKRRGRPPKAAVQSAPTSSKTAKGKYYNVQQVAKSDVAPKKRGRPPKNASPIAILTPSAGQQAKQKTVSKTSTLAATSTPKRGRGRPPKNQVAVPAPTKIVAKGKPQPLPEKKVNAPAKIAKAIPQPEKRGRGRPPKIALEKVSVSPIPKAKPLAQTKQISKKAAAKPALKVQEELSQSELRRRKRAEAWSGKSTPSDSDIKAKKK
jgi:ribonuclease R